MTPTSVRETRRLPSDTLRWVCDPTELGFETTSDLPTEATIVGQARGIRAIQFGLEIDQPGYNVFVSGPPGTGRSTYAHGEVQRLARIDRTSRQLARRGSETYQHLRSAIRTRESERRVLPWRSSG